MTNKINIYLLLGVLAIIWSGCDKDENSVPGLEVISATVNFQATGGEGVIELRSAGEVTVQADDTDWCSVKEVEASRITFGVKENYGIVGRNMSLTVRCGTASETLYISQAGAVFGYLNDEWILRTSNEAAEIPFTLYGSLDFEVKIPTACQSWLSFVWDKDVRKGKFIVGKNVSGSMRGTDISVVSGKRSVRYQVIQYDMDNMLGTWQGQFSDMEADYALTDVDIRKDADGTYTVSNMLTGSPFVLHAYASGNCLAFPAGQNTGSDGGLYFFFELVDAKGNFVSNPSQAITLGPVMQADGSFILAFGGVKEADPLAFVLRAYEDENMENLYESLFMQTTFYYIHCALYK